jgi:hypothetical protein
VVRRSVRKDRSSNGRRSKAEYTTVVKISLVESSLGIGSCRNGKKGIRLCQENFTCDLKLQSDCDKSVARIRLVKTENPIACAAVN